MDPVSGLLAEINAQQAQENLVALSPQEVAVTGCYEGDPSGLSGLATPQTLDDLLAQLGEEQKQSVRADLSHSVDPLLAKIKAYYQAKDQADILEPAKAQHTANLHCQPSNLEKQRPLTGLQSECCQVLTQQAQAWLKTVSPKTEEGLWFEEFAAHYSSRLAAAIDYLEALQRATP